MARERSGGQGGKAARSRTNGSIAERALATVARGVRDADKGGARCVDEDGEKKAGEVAGIGVNGRHRR